MCCWIGAIRSYHQAASRLAHRGVSDSLVFVGVCCFFVRVKLQGIVMVLRALKWFTLRVVYTLGPKYPNRDYFKGRVYTVWVHGPLGLEL